MKRKRREIMLRHRLAASAFTAARRRLPIAAALAVLPLCAAEAQDSEPQKTGAAVIAPQGVRIEALAGLDDDVFSGHGMLYGGRIGYDFKISPRFSLGIDGEYTDVTTDQSVNFFSGRISVEDGPDLYVGGRATFALSSRFRLHGAGGYTRARHGSFFLDSNNNVGGQEIVDGGFRLSAGGQFSLGRKAFIGAEYRYSEYNRFQKRDQYVATIGFRF
jgi:outer membrane immunogenic protein